MSLSDPAASRFESTWIVGSDAWNRRWDDEKGVPVPQINPACVLGFFVVAFLRSFFLFNLGKLIPTKIPGKTFPSKNHAKQFAIWNSWNDFNCVIIYNKFVQGNFPPKTGPFSKWNACLSTIIFEGLLVGSSHLVSSWQLWYLVSPLTFSCSPSKWPK